MQAAPGAPLSGDGPPAAPRRRRVAVLAGVAAFVLGADILTKALVVVHLREDQPVHVLGNVLMLDLLRNPGAAFSVGTGDTIVFTAIAVAVVAYIARTARNLRSIAWAITLGLLLGGALGNLGDRIFRAPGFLRGNVVDWIELTRYWPVFNLADSAIVCGGILTVLLALLGYHLDGSHGDRSATAVAAPAPDASSGGSSSEPEGAAVPGLRSEEPATSDEGRNRPEAPGGERDNGAL